MDGPTRVVIVGGGAAGMSCAATLANHPRKFKVTVLERADVCGGQATSIPLDAKKFGADWMNNGVQGGSPIFKHTFKYFKQYGHDPHDVGLQVSFGRGVEGFWTNCFPSPLVEKHNSDIRKFGWFLSLIKWTIPVLGLVPIRIMLRAMLFSADFGDRMVYPLIALFLGTGNQTANVPSAIVERLFDDPNMRLWNYDKEMLLPNLPHMLTFDNLGAFYEKWRKDLQEKGVDIRLRTEVTGIKRSKQGVTISTRQVDHSSEGNGSDTSDSSNGGDHQEQFDELVLCVLADDALKLLGSSATRRERFILGGASFYDDLTITHYDSEYFQKHYETSFQPELCADAKSDAQRDQVTFATGRDGGEGFRPMYYTKSYPSDGKKIEMSFDCSNYQHQLLDATKAAKKGAAAAAANGGRGPAQPQHVYQTIFLDKRNDKMWTAPEIDENKIIQKHWWHQLGHKWQHYLRVVPLMGFINGRNKTLFAGSWTLVNMHELACVSGIAAAYRLGADYDKFDDFAEDFFFKYLLLSHGWLYSRVEKQRQKAKKGD